MRELKKWELAVIAITLVFAAFVAGYFVGQRTTGSVSVGGGSSVTIETSKGGESALPEQSAPAEDTAEPSDSASPSGELLNINTATAEELAELPGIGEELAGRIIAYREEHGGFSAVDELMDVAGIGEGKYGACKALITVE